MMTIVNKPYQSNVTKILSFIKKGKLVTWDTCDWTDEQRYIATLILEEAIDIADTLSKPKPFAKHPPNDEIAAKAKESLDPINDLIVALEAGLYDR